ncbi:MAG: hypothetical protein Tsb0013_07410 [Phycisphaerales bacterium]
MDAYREKTREVQDLANAAAKEIREAAKEYMDELKRLSFEYQKLTGKSLPETQTIFNRGGAAASNGEVEKKPRRKRGALDGDYAGMTLPEAIKSVIKSSKEPLKAGDIADEIGGVRTSVAVALSNMAKEGALERVGRGLYSLP